MQAVPGQTDREGGASSHLRPQAATVEPNPADGTGSPCPGVPGDVGQAVSVLRLQQVLGNRAVQRYVAQQSQSARASADEPEADFVSRLAGAGSGQSLEPTVQRHLEQSLDADLSTVRVHSDSAADALARSVDAVAFTVGSDIFFSSGAYDPASTTGQHVLAHETAHVVQQAAGPVSGQPGPDGVAISSPGDHFEQAAEAVAAEFVSPGPAQLVAQPPQAPQPAPADRPSVQRLASRGMVLQRLTVIALDGAPHEEDPSTITTDEDGVTHDAAGNVVTFRAPDGVYVEQSAPALPGGTDGTAAAAASPPPGAYRPEIRHDHGFLDDGHGNLDESKRQEPTAQDYAALAWWRAKLDAAEILRPDLMDATRAYRHFLDANGAPLEFSYERFIAMDASGAIVLQSATEDIIKLAVEQLNNYLTANPASPTPDTAFDVHTEAIGVGGSGPRYPYPATENWQKAIGAHTIWVTAHVTVHVDNEKNECTLTIDMTLHAEDMYNFNPGASDIATGTPDSANGRFELTGLGHEFLSTATFEQQVVVTKALDPASTDTTHVGPEPLGVGGRPPPPHPSER